MKPLIDTQNYEAYYLDYLEGNLDAETMQLLEAFLAEHPELIVEGDLPALQPDIQIDAVFQLSLKKEPNEAVTASNLDYFLIAELEEQLSLAEQTALNDYLALHPNAATERKLVQSLVLESGTETYEHKESLKKRGGIVIPLWTKVAAAAAILLLFTLPFIRYSGEELTVQPQTAHSGGQSSTDTPSPSNNGASDNRKHTNTVATNNSGTATAQRSAKVSGRGSQKNAGTQTVTHPVKEQHRKELNISELPSRNISPSSPDLAIASVAQPTIAAAVSNNASESKMENPIPVITRGVSEALKTTVDVKTERAAGNKRGKGFYVRIGNVEVSRSASL